MLNIWILITLFYAQSNSSLTQEHQGQQADSYVYMTAEGCKREAEKKTGPVPSSDPFYPTKWAVASCHPITVKVR